MGTLIFCKNSIAASPYYIEEASLNVYSIEELSYYMLNNVYLLSNKFMTVELCNWIGRELKMQELSSQLLDLIRNNAPLHIFVGHILNSNGYSSKKEIKDLLAVIATFENKSEAERRKLRADRLMNNDKMVDAIYEYEAILADEVAKTLSRSVEGDVYHNLGCAFSRLYFFDEASRCFDEAYKRNQKKDSLLCLLYALRCKRNDQGITDAITKYQIPAEVVDYAMNTATNVAGDDRILEFNSLLNELHSRPGEEESFFSKAEEIIDDWKVGYSKLCRI